MISTDELNDIALAISNSCWAATVSRPTCIRGSMSTPSRSKSSLAFLFISASLMNAPPDFDSRPMKMFWAAVRWFIR